jgi:sugar transferase (PEP-CTERM/EpsH1 system associated)
METAIPATALSDSSLRERSVCTDARPLRVLHVVNRLDLGGTESGILKVATGLPADEFVHAVCTARGHSPEFAKQRSFSGQVFDAADSESQRQLLVYRFARIIRQFRPDVVHSRNWGAIEAVFAAKLAGVPAIVHSEHGYELHILKGLPLRQRLIRRAAYAAADSIFTVTSDLRDYHARQAGVRSSRITVIPNGVDSERFAPRPQTKSACRAALGLPEDSFLVGTVGRLVAIKDQALLIRAAKALVDRGGNISVALAGDGPERSNLAGLAAQLSFLDHVHFVGASKNVPDFLNSLDVFVLPSVSEGMSNTLLEAMSCGLPIVATSVGGNPELIENQVSGLLFPVGDTAQLVEHLSFLAQDSARRRTLGTKARERILDCYRLDAMLDSYRNLYQSLVTRRRTAGVRAA